jgi:Family of unknown function (DUF6069)
VVAEEGATGARPGFDATRLWTGGAATAVVAGLVALVGVLIARGVFGIPVLAPTSEGTWGNTSTWRLVLLAALAALVATGLMHLLLLSVPRPWRFFGWIIGLLTLAAAISPFTTDAELSTKVANALIYAAIGGSISSLVSSVARSAVRLRTRRGDWPA